MDDSITYTLSQLSEGGDSGEGEEEENDDMTSGGVAHPVTSASKKKKKKKKAKKKDDSNLEQVQMCTVTLVYCGHPWHVTNIKFPS